MPSDLLKGDKGMAVFGMVTQATFLLAQVVLMVTHGVRVGNVTFALLCVCGITAFTACYLRMKRKEKNKQEES